MEEFAQSGGGVCQLAGIVQSVREVKTKSGGRMGIVSLTDTSGQGEIALFPETYSRLYDILHSKEPLVFTTKVHHDGERLRANADTVKSLSAMLAERVELVLTLSDSNQLSSLKTELDKVERGNTKVKLLVPANGHHAIVKVPYGIRCNPTFMTNVKGLGVGIG
jgi:DNA polymerase-3 subunit alpha